MIDSLGRVRRFRGHLLAAASVLAVSMAGAPQAEATDVGQLEAQMKAKQAQLHALQQQVEEAKAAAAKAAAPSGGGEASDLKVKWKGAPELSSVDGRFKFKVRGRVNVDYDGIDQDQRITGDPDVSAVELRRARLGVEGVVFYDWKYRFEVDFTGDDVTIKDAFVEYTGLPVDIRLGNFKAYNSLEEQTSANYLTFMERAAFIEGFTLDYLTGAGVFRNEKHWTASAGVFSTTPILDQSTFFEDGTTFAARVTAAPINRERHVVHLGASARHRDAAADPRDGVADPLFRYRARGADLHLADRFVSTPQIGEADTFWGLEGAVVLGSFSVQGEYGQDKVEIPVGLGGAAPTYDGWYVDGSWFLTGESRPYDDGVFGRVRVKNPVFGGSGGWGAWQIAGRYDPLDLSDQAGSIPGCVECGQQTTWLVGVNWYLNDYTRLMLNVNQSTIEGGVNDGAEITGVGMRAQVDW